MAIFRVPLGFSGNRVDGKREFKFLSKTGPNVNILTQNRARGLLRHTGILDDAHAEAEAYKAQGEVDMYRIAVGLANGMQNPVQYKLEFKCPQGINQPQHQRQGGPPNQQKMVWVAPEPNAHVMPNSIDFRAHEANQSSRLGILNLYMDAAQVASTLWKPYGRKMPGEESKVFDYEKKDTVLNLFCSKVSIPEKSINYASMRHYGTHFAYPQSVSYGSMSTTFYCDASMKIKKFFDAWQKLIYNDITGNFNYYDEYTSSFDVFTRAGVATDKFYDNPSKKSNIFKRGTEKLNEWTGNAGPKKNAIKIPMMEFRNTYGVQIMECWPQIVGAIDLGHTSTNSVAEFSVTWVYKKWNTFNLGEITKRGRTINLSSGIYLDEGDGLPILRDLPQELQGPLNARMDQQAMQSPIINAARITG